MAAVVVAFAAAADVGHRAARAMLPLDAPGALFLALRLLQLLQIPLILGVALSETLLGSSRPLFDRGKLAVPLAVAVVLVLVLVVPIALFQRSDASAFGGGR